MGHFVGGTLDNPNVVDKEAGTLSLEAYLVLYEATLDKKWLGRAETAASFAETDGTYTNNAGNVQRVRQAIEPFNQAKPDWVITSLIAREMGADFGYNFSATMVFKAIAESVSAYEGLRYPALKDESNPVQAKYAVSSGKDLSKEIETLTANAEKLSGGSEKITETPRVGHKLHRLTVMTGKTPQFHLLAHGNPKPENLLVSPLAQFNADGSARHELAGAVSVGDRVNVKVG